MGVKGLTLLGLITSSLLVYVCINSNKDRLYKKILAKKSDLNITKKVAKNEKKILATAPLVSEKNISKEIEQKSVIPTINPYFRYTNRSLDVNLSKNQKETLTKEIDKIAVLDDNLSKSISFDEKIKEFDDMTDLEELILLSKKDKVKDFALSLVGTKISISGEVDNDSKLKEFDDILQKLENKKYDIENNLMVTEIKKEKKIEPTKIVKEQKEEKTPTIDDSKENKKIVIEEVIENKAQSQNAINNDAKKVLEKKKIVPEQKEEKKTIKPIKKKEIKHKVKKRKKVIKQSRVVKDVKANDLFVVTDKIDKYEASDRINNLLLSEPLDFDLNGGILTHENKLTLKKIASIIKDTQDNIRVVINVYTQKNDETTYNKVLSQKIANKIKNYLIQNGIKSSKIEANGKGFINPIADPYDSVNNRVEIEII